MGIFGGNKWKTVLGIAVILTVICGLFAASFAEESDEIVTEFSPIFEIAKVGSDSGNDLAEGYIRKKMYPRKQGLLYTPLPSGIRLKGADRYLYQALLPMIANVAAGNSSDTFFSFPAENVYEKLSFTAGDLGVESIFLTKDGVTGVRKKAKDEMERIITEGIGQSGILKCLMADCPYEMYWYDKTTGNLLQYPSMTTGYENGEDVLIISGNVVFNMAVSTEYRDAAKEPRRFTYGDGSTGEYYCNVDTAWGQSVSRAVQKARAIVDQYEDLEDYERLYAYRDEIKALTGYNHEAADGGVPYGNPWQLVYVFDGDPNTKVVCEGYSKAFQYLNDLSGSDVTVICVSGTMNDGPHMWNIVRMDDEQNYLADITNCYKDEYSGKEYLFLVGGDPLGTDIDGYSFAWGTETQDYIYDGDNFIREAEELSIADKGYLEAKPPVPSFVPGENKDSFMVGTPVDFSYNADPEQSYDSFLVKVSYTPNGSTNTTVLTREVVTLSAKNQVWSFGPEYHMSGTYQVQFAGRRGTFTSLWSEPVALQPGYTADLGRIGFTEATLSSLGSVSAGDEGSLAWNTASAGINSFTIQLAEYGGIVQYNHTFGASETETEFLWTVCPGDYTLSFVPDVAPGYAYAVDDSRTVAVKYSGKAWRLDGEGTITKYFGSDTKPTVPEEIDGIEVIGVGSRAFEKSKAGEVTVPSTVAMAEDAFSGSSVKTVKGYERSDAETAAGFSGISFVSLGIKPNVPVYRASAVHGYTGYTLVFRLAEDTDAVRVKETGEVLACNGKDVLIPLTEAGDFSYTFSAIKDDVRGDYGETIPITVGTPGSSELSIPDGIRDIYEEAFRGLTFSRLVIPASVRWVGAFAFADSAGLQIIEAVNPGIINRAAFSGSDGAVFLFASADEGYNSGWPFLIGK